MLRVNLGRKGPRFRAFDVWKATAAGLVLVLAFQAWTWYAWQRHDERRREETSGLEARLAELERESQALALPCDPRVLAGAVIARNDWLREKARSPAQDLARLERFRPPAGELIRFEATRGAGTLGMLVPDTDTAMRWVNAAFPGAKGRVNIDERRQGMLTVTFAWTE